MTTLPDREEYVILVDSRDREIGLMEKMEAHRRGFLHRAFSVFIFNDKGEMLLQRRAAEKYHSGGLWTNACCSHPRKNEEVKEAAQRRLKEEMGLTVSLKKVFSFIYSTPLNNELTEHELDHVFIGFTNENPFLNPDEAEEYKWSDPEMIRMGIKDHPSTFTEWFKLCFEELMNHYSSANPTKDV